MNRLACGVVLVSAAAFCADLPVTEVILYKNGIGYFVRSGELKPGEPAALHFKAEEMNDVLKSLTIVDDGGGRISGLRYDSSEPLATKLSAFPFKLGDRQPLSALLDQLRGARVEMKTGPETVSGILMTAREILGGDKTPQREQATLLLDSGELRTLDLAAITSVRFTDAALQEQFKRYLGDVAAGRSKDKRSVYVDSTDLKGGRLTASYVVPSPVWKSSYRLVFTDAAEPTLEGWAIVDNTTGEDWTKVRLALVSGRPVSFVSNLYEPRILEREVAELSEERAAKPKVYGGAMERAQMGVPGGSAGGVIGGILGAVPTAAPPPQAPSRLYKNEMVTVASSVAPSTEASERGELFEYRFGTPVTVRSGESAMLPFLQQKIATRKLLIYSGDGDQGNPRNAAEIRNSTGKSLDGGPITVFDANTYGGEALMETVKAGDKRLISYAVDLGTRITTRLYSSSIMVREIHARRGILTVRSAVQGTTTYTIRNVDQKPKTLIIEHAIRSGYKLLNAKPAETTASAYRFEVKLAPGASDKFPVNEERVYDQTITLTNTSPDSLFAYIQNKNLDEAARKQLERIAAQKSEIARNDGEIRATDQQISEIVHDQDRLRQNVMSLNQVSGQQDQVQKYAALLAGQETQLASLRDRQSEQRKKKAALVAELDKLIESAEF